MRKIYIPLSWLLVILIAACSSTTSPTSTQPASGLTGLPASSENQPAGPTQAPEAGLSGLNRDKLSSYSSSFVIQFNGAKPWTYRLKTRKSPTLREISLHIDGITGKDNPGDVRLVTDGVTSWMSGAGTENECVQFPNNLGMDPKWIYPESVVSVEDMTAQLKYVGEEKVAGTASLHYAVSGAAIGKWTNASIDVWQEKISRTLLQFKMQAAGEDPFFGTGTGKMDAQYSVAGLDVATIEPVSGCEISVPLPDTANDFIRLPGMASFESPASIDDMRNFYQAKLPADGWAEKDPPSLADGSTILSYKRNADEVEIHIEDGSSGGSKVRLIFMKAQ